MTSEAFWTLCIVLVAFLLGLLIYADNKRDNFKTYCASQGGVAIVGRCFLDMNELVIDGD
jgi:hypothetical protein